MNHDHIERERFPKVTKKYEDEMRKTFSATMKMTLDSITKKMVGFKKEKK